MWEDSVPVGSVIVGRYRVEQHLGSGGMGLVVAAWDTTLNDRVAIKILHPEAARTGDAVARFLGEAKAARRIKSAHAVKVLEVGSASWSTPDHSQPYLVMEYLEGEDLASLIRREGPLRPEVAVEYVLQACEALAEAHRQGIVHRDVKPSNLFLACWPDGRSRVKVLDFGIAKLPMTPGAPTEAMFRTTGMLGTALYASPEQLQSARHVDARSDIWSIGITLFELLSGQYPFLAEDLAGLVAHVLANPPERLNQYAPNLAPGLVATVHRCLEKQRDDRFADVAELAAALAPHAGANGLHLAETVARVLGARSSVTTSPPANVSAAAAEPLVGTLASARTSQGTTIYGTRRRQIGMGLLAGTAVSALVLAAGTWIHGTWGWPESSAAVSAAGAEYRAVPTASVQGSTADSPVETATQPLPLRELPVVPSGSGESPSVSLATEAQQERAKGLPLPPSSVQTRRGTLPASVTQSGGNASGSRPKQPAVVAARPSGSTGPSRSPNDDESPFEHRGSVAAPPRQEQEDER